MCTQFVNKQLVIVYWYQKHAILDSGRYHLDLCASDVSQIVYVIGALLNKARVGGIF